MPVNRLAIATLGATAAALMMALWIQGAKSESSKIASIGGDVTEILYALDQQARIVAVDATSQFPPEALKDKKNVGYMRALSTEGVLSVAASVIIASDRAGPAEVVKALKSAVPYVEVIDGTSPDGVPAKIRAVAAAAGVGQKGETLAAKVSGELADLELQRKSIKKPLRALFVLSVQSGRATVGGTGSSADAILKLAGLENAASMVQGFKPVGDEALLEMKPDVVVVLRRSAGGHDASEAVKLPGLNGSSAARGNRVIAMDGLYLLGFGPRVAEAARELMTVAYQDEIGTKPGAIR
jgi:iron complex transport system substrate-binding protein